MPNEYRITVRTLAEEDAGQAGDIIIKDTLPPGFKLNPDKKPRIDYYTHQPNNKGGFDRNKAYLIKEDKNEVQITVGPDNDITVVIPSSVLLEINKSQGNLYTGQLQENDLIIMLPVDYDDQDYWELDGPAMRQKTYDNTATVENTMNLEGSKGSASHTHIVVSEPGVYLQKGSSPRKDKDIIDYEIILNPNSKTLVAKDEFIILKDKLSNENPYVSLAIRPNFVKVYEYSGDQNAPIKMDANGNPIEVEVRNQTLTTDGLEMYVPDSKAMVLSYTVDVERLKNDNGEIIYEGAIDISNTADLAGFKSNSVSTELSKVSSSQSGFGQYRALEIRKIDSQDLGKDYTKDISITDVAFGLSAYENDAWVNKSQNIKPDLDLGVVEIDFTHRRANQLYGTEFKNNVLYKLTETKTPEGYMTLDKPCYFVLLDAGVSHEDGFNNLDKPADLSIDDVIFIPDLGSKTLIIPNTLIPNDVTIKGTKTWDDNDDTTKRPDSIIVKLMDGENLVQEQTVTPDADGNWIYEFNNLPRYRTDGSEIVYSIAEVAVSGYSTSVDGYNITNTLITTEPEPEPEPEQEEAKPKKPNLLTVPELIRIEGQKVWDDNNNQDGIRPEKIIVRVKDGDRVLQEKELTEEDNWKYTFNNLAKNRYDGSPIEYTIEEEHVVGYVTSVDGYNITNTHIPETVTISGEKIWNHGRNAPANYPESIIVKLLADGVEVDQLEVRADSNGQWLYAFKDKAAYQDGKRINYTVSECQVDGYSSQVDGYTITNTYIQPQTEPTPDPTSPTEPTTPANPGSRPPSNSPTPVEGNSNPDPTPSVEATEEVVRDPRPEATGREVGGQKDKTDLPVDEVKQDAKKLTHETGIQSDPTSLPAKDKQLPATGSKTWPGMLSLKMAILILLITYLLTIFRYQDVKHIMDMILKK